MTPKKVVCVLHDQLANIKTAHNDVNVPYVELILVHSAGFRVTLGLISRVIYFYITIHY